MEARTPFNEWARLGDLYALDLLDRNPDERFDRITRVTRRTFDVPTSLVSLVDANRQWFCSRQGLDAAETPRRDAFCAHTIVDPDGVMWVPDAQSDPRFADNPLVLGPPHIRFYAGAPISSPGGHRIGTLCIIDNEVRDFDASDRQSLRDLADLVERELHHVRLALLDPLTGLANSRAFNEAAKRLIPLAAQHAKTVSVLYADIDGLKQVNDVHGHAAGDDLLRRAADVLVSAVRGSDLVARVGGDEFAILMYGSGAGARADVAEGIQAAIADHNRTRLHGEPLSISIGLAHAQAGDSMDSVTTRADVAMYAQKQQRLAVAGGDRFPHI